MSAPQPNVPKGGRRSAKKGHTAHSRSAISETETSDFSSHQPLQSDDGKSRPRRKSHAKKTNLNYDSAVQSDDLMTRNTHQPTKAHATPVKPQAYAGPTFHQSPAASALPLPSFYSKSLPTASMMKTAPEHSRPVTEQGENAAIHGAAEVERESTPLDFLFEAARKAHASPRSDSPQNRYLSPGPGKSPSRSPAPAEPDTVFDLEMDSNYRGVNGSTSTLSTPFKDRLEAARPNSSTPKEARSLDEADRKAKTAALKTFLMNSAQAIDSTDNPFNARPAPQSTPPRSYQQRSNPTTPMYGGYVNNNGHQYFPYQPQPQNGFPSPNQRPPGSNLRNIYAPDTVPKTSELGANEAAPAHQSRISTSQDQTPPHQPYQGYLTPPRQESPSQKPTPSAQQLEDDLRRFLKLDSQVAARF